MNEGKQIVSQNMHSDFFEVYGIIQTHRQRIASTVDNESLLMIWKVGRYVSAKLKDSFLGDGVVRQLAEFIHTQDTTSRGWSFRTIYKMVQLYETYSNESIANLLKQTKMLPSNKFVPVKMVQIASSKSNSYESNEIVPIASAQISMVPFQYKEQLKIGSVIQRSLVKFCEYRSNSK